MARRFDLVILGLGSAGMVAAEWASTLPIKVAAVEAERVGGDCLWTGCVPSKALLASAKVAHHMRTAGAFGIEPVEPRIDTARVFGRIRSVQGRIGATDDSPEHIRGLGVELFEGRARLVAPNVVEVGGERLETRFVLLCTGGRPAVPPLPGLEEAGYLTSETIWEVERPPASIVALGGGPIAIEMAQGFRRLGVPVTVLQRGPRVLPRDEPDLVDRLVGVLRDEGVDLRLGTEADRVSVEAGEKVVHAGAARFAAQEIVVGVGRRPNVEGLGLEDVGVEVGEKGVVVDEGLRTSAEWVYAAGDVTGGDLFTHAAGFQAVRAVRNMFFPGRTTREQHVPWCTFTDPELAHAGLTSAEARERFGDDEVEVHRQELARSDRARAEGAEEGAVVVVTRKGRVVGAHVLAPSAGDLIGELSLAIDQGLKLADLGRTIHVYPTIATELGRLGAEAAFGAAERLQFLIRSRA